MDPLTALSVAGTVIQFVDFGTKLISESVKLYKKGELEVHEQAVSATNDILDYTIKLRRTLRPPGESAALTDDEILLENICKGCDDLANDLLSRLNKLTVPQKDKKGRHKIWPSLTAAFQSIWTSEDLLDIQERLKEYRRQIDSRVIQSLSKRIDRQFLEQSERFNRLDAANKDIATALVNRNASDDRGLQAQISALSTLLDRAEVVVASREQAHQRIIVDVFQQIALAPYNQADNLHIAQIREIDQEIRTSVSTELLESLYFLSITERIEAVDESHATTFDWIFRPIEETSQYAEGRRWGDFSQWLQYSKGLYWINGKAGSGKSTLVKYIVNHKKTQLLLKHWAGNSELCSCNFFFWNSGSKLQCSQAGLFRTLLYDILVRHPDLIPMILPSQWATRYSAKFQGRYMPRESWQLSTLKTAFKYLVSQTRDSLKLCIFIDGLDEYEGDEQEVAEFFGQVSMTDNVKICCSSRPHQAFEDAFAARPGLRLQDLTIPDMRQYVHDKLEKNSRMQQLSVEEPEATKELIEEIGNAATGVFLWVRLVVTSLVKGLGKHDDIWYLQKRLRELPQELDELFDQMVFKVDKVYQEETARLFQLVGSAFRDQNDKHFLRSSKQMSILLLSFACERDTTLALEAAPGFLTKEKVTTRCQRMEVDLRVRCGGLLEVQYGMQDPSTTTVSSEMIVTYLHRTVKDYLELRDVRQKLADRTGSQRDTFTTSVAILKAHILLLKALDATGIIERPPWTVLEDAIMWARRAERDTQTSQPELVEEFYGVACQIWNKSQEKTYPSHSREDKNNFFQEQESALSLAARCGLYHYLEAKLSQGDVISTWNQKRSLLDYALNLNKYEATFINVGVVGSLLKHGAEPNKPELMSATSPWQNVVYHLANLTPKDWFVQQSEAELREIKMRWARVVELLLEYGANPELFIHTSAFEFDPRLLAEVKTAIEEAKRKWKEGKTSKTPDKERTSGPRDELKPEELNDKNGCSCCLVQ